MQKIQLSIDKAMYEEFYTLMEAYRAAVAANSSSHGTMLVAYRRKRDKHQAKIESSDVWTPQAKYGAYALAVQILEFKK